MDKHYCLYTDLEQTKLLACARGIDQMLEQSQYYSDGCWFEYDVSISEKDTTFLLNEREFGFKQFPINPSPRPNLLIKSDDRVTFSTR
jgi:hypothetical protein